MGKMDFMQCLCNVPLSVKELFNKTIRHNKVMTSHVEDSNVHCKSDLVIAFVFL